MSSVYQGVITSYVKETHNIDLIIVGGLSVEIYTEGGYATQDIDFVGPGHEEIMDCLVDLGFTRQGKDSIHEELEVYVEVPSSVLKEADVHYVRQDQTEDGFTINIIGIEDIIKSRLRAYIHWKEEVQLKWIIELLERFISEIDIDYMRATLLEDEQYIFDKIIDAVMDAKSIESILLKLMVYMDEKNVFYNEIDDIIISSNSDL